MRRSFVTLCLTGIRAALLVSVCIGLLVPAVASAQPGQPGKSAAAPAAESGPRWHELSVSQRAALKPLERDWSSVDAARKQKWMEIAARYPNLPPAEQQRISARMAEWAKLSPSERGQARLNYQATRELAPEDRQARWQAYQALSAEQRGTLAARAAPASASAARNGEAGRKAAPRDAVQAKSNIVPNPSLAAPPKAVGPTVVQARPGATTSLISSRPVPPTHQQPGMPKIAASPGFVDKSTLLPQRGAQGAAAATTSDPAAKTQR